MNDEQRNNQGLELIAIFSAGAVILLPLITLLCIILLSL